MVIDSTAGQYPCLGPPGGRAAPFSVEFKGGIRPPGGLLEGENILNRRIRYSWF